MNSVRVLISLTTNYGWSLLQFDVKNAFLHGDLEEEVYMDTPPGFQTTNSLGKVCKLRKALYGLKQSPRAWFERFRTTMVNAGYMQAQADHTLFIKHQGKKITTLIVYVDDIVITGNDDVEISSLKKKLSNEFKIKDLGSRRYFLGIEVARLKQGVFLSQRKYVLDLLLGF